MLEFPASHQLGGESASRFPASNCAVDPVGFLCESHREIERFLSSLIRIAKDSRDGQEREPKMFATALRYFSAISPDHTADEEESLFPRLRRASHPEINKVLRQLEPLEEEHGCADRAHDEVNRLGKLWLASGRLSPSQTDRLATVLAGLGDLYRRNIQVEECGVFPLVAGLLQPEDLESLGTEMIERHARGTGRNAE